MAYADEPELRAPTMPPNAQTLTKFYTAFAALDPDTMATCYADDAAFEPTPQS